VRYTGPRQPYVFHPHHHHSILYRAIRFGIIAWVIWRLTAFALRTVVTAIAIPIILGTLIVAFANGDDGLSQKMYRFSNQLVHWWFEGLYGPGSMPPVQPRKVSARQKRALARRAQIRNPWAA
jgi:hypothetical protein